MKLLRDFVAVPADQLTAVTHADSQIAVAETEKEVLDKKAKFAELFLKEPNSFKVACVIYPDDTSKALRVANSWPTDPIVLEFQKSLVDAEGELKYLPSEAEDLKEIRAIALQLYTERNDNAYHYHKMYLEARGRIGKAQVIGQQTNVFQQNVMVVKDHGTDEEWERKAMTQQARLRQEALADVVSDQ